MIEFEYSYQQITSEDIKNFENQFSVKLPLDYKKFLLQCNGGKPVKRRFKTADETITSSLMLFLPLSKEIKFNLYSYYHQFNRIPKEVSLFKRV
ncbi:hypothetical protein A374_01494 [Fictibacillus macauensis ZFHKF-1]|uniref:Knr4/Smi1-like domain-containing protein n=1 Tax=Fictibacillus macauensis ZFHKF-1 TaxID=1196324 RepID=I8J5W0_9BACL|nr:SMI1/KNR4 family protein [Fictibacillus macauensis]EIT87191.1 hypothetical protein A374_01494 [Fictibacillus macauensis ZFHKF-1]